MRNALLMLVALVMLAFMLKNEHVIRGGPRYDLPNPLPKAKERLLKLHPNWKACGYGFDDSFGQRGYFSTRVNAKEPRLENETHALLGAGSPEAISTSQLEELSEDHWRGLVFARAQYIPGLFGDKGYIKPGWYGRVLVRNGCLFFGDKEMLKEIDKSLSHQDQDLK